MQKSRNEIESLQMKVTRFVVSKFICKFFREKKIFFWNFTVIKLLNDLKLENFLTFSVQKIHDFEINKNQVFVFVYWNNFDFIFHSFRQFRSIEQNVLLYLESEKISMRKWAMTTVMMYFVAAIITVR